MGWEAWTAYHLWLLNKKKTMRMWMQPMLASGFNGWRDSIENMKYNRRKMTQVLAKIMNMKLAAAFTSWMSYVQVK
jgi:hypothetical protein